MSATDRDRETAEEVLRHTDAMVFGRSTEGRVMLIYQALSAARREERERCAKVLEARSAEWLPLSVVTARHYELAARVIRDLDGAQ